MTLKCILALRIIPCFVCPHTLCLLSDLQLAAHDILYKDLFQAIQCSKKEKTYWVGSSPGMQPMAGDLRSVPGKLLGNRYSPTYLLHNMCKVAFCSSSEAQSKLLQWEGWLETKGTKGAGVAD